MSAPALEAFPRDLLEAEAPEAAAALLGAYLVRSAGEGRPERIARIVEVEAYGGEEDLASHARSGRTARNAAMWAAPGTAYVYLVYGMYDCLNVAVAPAGRASAVLIRAAEPVTGPEPFREARSRHGSARRRATAAATPARPVAPERLLAGPGVLGAALDVTRALDGIDLLDPAAPLRLARAAGHDPIGRGGAPPRVLATPRIGIGYAPEPWRSRPWRLLDPASPSVSGPRPRPRPEA